MVLLIENPMGDRRESGCNTLPGSDHNRTVRSSAMADATSTLIRLVPEVPQIDVFMARAHAAPAALRA